MACKRCSFCCRVNIQEVKGNAIKLLQYRENFIKVEKVNGINYALMKSECVHLKGNRCGRYDRRPEQCKDFPTEDIKKVWKALYPECGLV